MRGGAELYPLATVPSWRTWLLTTPDVAALLAITGLAEGELAPFCAVAAAVLDGQHDLAHGMAVRLWRCGHRQLLWAPEVRRLVLQAGPWAPPGVAAATPRDVRVVEDALGLTRNGPAHEAWRRALARGRTSARG